MARTTEKSPFSYLISSNEQEAKRKAVSNPPKLDRLLLPTPKFRGCCGIRCWFIRMTNLLLRKKGEKQLLRAEIKISRRDSGSDVGPVAGKGQSTKGRFLFAASFKLSHCELFSACLERQKALKRRASKGKLISLQSLLRCLLLIT